jgi:hypothetical protein
LPDKTSPATGKAPSRLTIEPNWAVARPAGINTTAAISAVRRNLFLMGFFMDGFLFIVLLHWLVVILHSLTNAESVEEKRTGK